MIIIKLNRTIKPNDLCIACEDINCVKAIVIEITHRTKLKQISLEIFQFLNKSTMLISLCGYSSCFSLHIYLPMIKRGYWKSSSAQRNSPRRTCAMRTCATLKSLWRDRRWIIIWNGCSETNFILANIINRIKSWKKIITKNPNISQRRNTKHTIANIILTII